MAKGVRNQMAKALIFSVGGHLYWFPFQAPHAQAFNNGRQCLDLGCQVFVLMSIFCAFPVHVQQSVGSNHFVLCICFIRHQYTWTAY
jgi:hypothetical protein